MESEYFTDATDRVCMLSSTLNQVLLCIINNLYTMYHSRVGNKIIQSKTVAKSAGAVEYSDCVPAERYNSSNKCPG